MNKDGFNGLLDLNRRNEALRAPSMKPLGIIAMMKRHKIIDDNDTDFLDLRT